MKELGTVLLTELPALVKVRQEDGEFGPSLSYMINLFFSKSKLNK